MIRIPNLRWGLPEVEEEALPVRKAFEMWGWDQGHLTLDAQTAGWPSLSFYVQLALQKLQYTIGRLTGRYDGPLDFFVEHAELATLMPAARFLSIGLALAVVVIGVRLALRLAGWFGALTTGLVLCLSPLLIEQSIKVTPDILLTLFSALALGSFLDVYERGRHRDYVASAVWIGLGVASKYTPVLLLPCLLAAHVARPAAIPFWRRIFDGRLLLAGVVCAATCFAASPFTFLNLAAAQRDMPLQFMHVVSSGHFGHELQQKGHVFYMVTVLPEALGWPALVLGVTGLVLAAWRKRGAWIVVLLSFACYYAGLGALRSLHAHYMLPSLLSLALGLAGLAGELERVTAVRGRRWFVAGASGLLALIGCPLAALSARELLRYSRPSTLQESKRFIMEELNRPDATFACEVGGPNLPRSPEADFAHRPVFRRLDAPSRERLLSRPFVHRFVMYMYMTEANRSDVYYDLRHYVNYDYIIVSGTAYHRYVGMAETYPRQNAFYQDLERYGELVRYFPESKDRIGPNVWIYRVGSRMRQILEDRGRLARGFHAAYLAKVRREDLHAFLGFTGDLAARKEDWQSADLYLSTLLDLRPEIRDELLLTVAHAKYKAGNFIEAAELCAERLRHHPGDLKAQALGAAIVKGSAAALPGEHGL